MKERQSGNRDVESRDKVTKKEKVLVLREFLKELEDAYPNMAAAATIFSDYSRRYPELLQDLKVALKEWLDRITRSYEE
ncbi:hypothetical protein KEJ36_00705 [Candidatus Bathyarchaeota archaeon]|nr:hypothetical protein [Candidatus Bathyarchaeota archaeon]MBS7627344.1 hypothetical protein [Candidatus Bathyarchaeota archaeon]